jgi:hypothetical protein
MEKITTHIEDAKSRMIERYRNSPKFEGVISLFAEKMQALEDAIDYFQNHRWIADAEGFQLDLIGEIVGQPREGVNDTTYRVLLYVKVAINAARGDPESVIGIFNLITGATKSRYFSWGNLNVSLQGNGTNPLSSAAKLHKQIQRVLPAGVKLTMLGLSNAKPFRFAGGFGGGAGFYNASDPTTSGKWATLLLGE